MIMARRGTDHINISEAGITDTVQVGYDVPENRRVAWWMGGDFRFTLASQSALSTSLKSVRTTCVAWNHAV